MSILKKGMKGAPIKRMQAKLGVAADGDFGPGTLKALKEFQAANGLAVDGIAGPDTFASMGLFELILLRKGSRGAQVKKLQEALGVAADGVFGSGTEAALKTFQDANGLVADGLAGPNTLSKIASFAGDVTADVVQNAQIKPDEEAFEAEPMPEISGVEVKTGSVVPVDAGKSVWGKVKGWFS